MSIRHGIVLGFASCGVYGGGADLHHIRILEGLKAADAAGRCAPSTTSGVHGNTVVAAHNPVRSSATPGVGRVEVTMLVVGAATVAVVFVANRTSTHIRWWPNAQHVGLLLTHGLQHLTLADPLVLGAVAVTLLVAAFAVLVTAFVTDADTPAPGPRTLVNLGSRTDRGASPRYSGQRARRAGRSRFAVLTRRPPTLDTSRPVDRVLTRRTVLRRTTR